MGESLHEKGIESDSVKHGMWNVRAAFCGIYNISYQQYLIRDAAPEVQRLWLVQNSTVQVLSKHDL